MIAEMTCKGFLEALGSAAPTPGGGGAAVLAGAMGACLGSMVAELTTGKKKYAPVQADIDRILSQCQVLSERFLELANADAEGFKPLAAAYGIPKDRPDRPAIMAAALTQACQAPLAMMRTALEGLQLMEELAEKGSTMAVSDVGAGVQMLRAALLGTSLNIYINARIMADRSQAGALLAETKKMEDEGRQLADTIFMTVKGKLQ